MFHKANVMQIEEILLRVMQSQKELKEEVQMLTKKLEAGVEPKQEPDEIIDIKEVSRITGYTVNTIYSKKSKKEIPFLEYDGIPLRFNKSAIIEWIDNKYKKRSNAKNK